MKKENSKVKNAALASSAAIIGAFGVNNVNAADLFSYEDLGTGSELRSNLIDADAMSAFTSNTDVELECGEGKCGEGKCGEGKCGEKSDEKKADADDTKESKAAMSPVQEGSTQGEKVEKVETDPVMMQKSSDTKSTTDSNPKK